jgi:CBS domain-containing protein
MTEARAAAGSKPLDEVAVADVMHRGVVSCALEAPLAEVAHLLSKHRVHCVVGYGDVTEDDTQVWGVISDLDVISAAAEGSIHGLSASATATTEPLTVAPDATVAEAVRLMHEHAVSHLLVVEPGADRPVGVLSTLDVAGLLASPL